MKSRTKKRSRRGQGLAESAVAALILIPIALCMVDLICLVIANSMNDTCVKNAARAAANQSSGEAAYDAAVKALESFKSSGIVKSITIEDLIYAKDKSVVSCQTTMVVRLPIPVPFFSDITFKAKDVEPVMVK